MNKNLILVSILLIGLSGLSGEKALAKANGNQPKATSGKSKESAKASSSEKAEKSENQMKSQLGTSFRFDGSSLHGKYQTSPSTTAMVEDDKFIDDLLGARKSFNDRIEKDRERN